MQPTVSESTNTQHTNNNVPQNLQDTVTMWILEKINNCGLLSSELQELNKFSTNPTEETLSFGLSNTGKYRTPIFVCSLKESIADVLLSLFEAEKISVEVVQNPMLRPLTSSSPICTSLPLFTSNKQLHHKKQYWMLLSVVQGKTLSGGSWYRIDKDNVGFEWHDDPTSMAKKRERQQKKEI